MHMFGGKILNIQKTIDGLFDGWPASFELAAQRVLSEATVDDDTLAAKIYEGICLHKVEIAPVCWTGQSFQVSHKSIPGRTDTFYSFHREFQHTGSQILFRQRPFTGYSTDLRVTLGVPGEATIRGICSRGECDTLHAYLEELLYAVNRAMDVGWDQLEWYNSALPGAIRNFILCEREKIRQMREHVLIAR